MSRNLKLANPGKYTVANFVAALMATVGPDDSIAGSIDGKVVHARLADGPEDIRADEVHNGPAYDFVGFLFDTYRSDDTVYVKQGDTEADLVLTFGSL